MKISVNTILVEATPLVTTFRSELDEDIGVNTILLKATPLVRRFRRELDEDIMGTPSRFEQVIE